MRAPGVQPSSERAWCLASEQRLELDSLRARVSPERIAELREAIARLGDCREGVGAGFGNASPALAAELGAWETRIDRLLAKLGGEQLTAPPRTE